MTTVHELIAVLERGKGGREAALHLQLQALLSASEGDLAAATDALSAAQTSESALGFKRAALHTSHKLALITNFGGDLARLGRYYQETLGTLKKLKQREGTALVLRSIGELALLQGKRGEMEKAWELSERLFEALQLPEARQMSSWRAAMAELEIGRES